MAQTARRDDIVKVGQCYDVLNILKCYDILNILKSNMLKICIYRRGADGSPRRHRQGGPILRYFDILKCCDFFKYIKIKYVKILYLSSWRRRPAATTSSRWTGIKCF